MKVLLDECVPHPLRTHLTGYDVFTVKYMGWAGIKNGRLLSLAAGAGFDALITTDQNIEHQTNPASLQLAIVVIVSPTNDLVDLVLRVPISRCAR